MDRSRSQEAVLAVQLLCSITRNQLTNSRTIIRKTLRAERRPLIGYRAWRVIKTTLIDSPPSRKGIFMGRAQLDRTSMPGAPLTEIKECQKFKGQCKYQRREVWINGEKATTASTTRAETATRWTQMVQMSRSRHSLTDNYRKHLLHPSRSKVYRKRSQWAESRNHRISNHHTSSKACHQSKVQLTKINESSNGKYNQGTQSK